MNKSDKSNKSIIKHPYLLYSILFVLLLPIVFLPFLVEGKSFVWYIDGINQHYPILLHYGKMLRGVLAGNGFPMVDFQVGMGFDTITTLHYYVLGDPLALLSVFMTQGNGVFLYGAMILLRFYLIGISYMIFTGYWGNRGHGRILGALIYVFCGYTFYSGVRHPFFLNPMIYLPLFLIGLELALQRKKPYLLIGMAFLCTMSNFYFLYILSVIAVIYSIFRYFMKFRKEYKNQFVGLLLTGLRVGGFYLAGVALAAVIFVPVVYAFLNNGRMDDKPQLLTSFFFYNKKYYLNILQGTLASGVSSGYWVDLAFPSIAAICVVILLCNNKYRQLRIVFWLATAGLLVPAFGYFMNGFTYVTNRWDFLNSFLIALLFTVTYTEIFKLSKSCKVLLGIGIAGYGILTFAFRSHRVVKYSFFILLITALVVLLLQTKRFKVGKKLQYGVLYLLVIFSLGFNGYAFYAGSLHGYVKEFYSAKQVHDMTAGEEANAIKQIDDKGFYRVETYGDDIRNEALIMGYNDVSAYYSLMDGNVTNYLKQLENVNLRTAYRFDNFDNRVVLDALANVKYLVTTKRSAAPCAYRLIKTIPDKSNTYYVYENTLALPLGYTYDSYMLEEDYNKLSALEKQNALMSCAVLEKDSGYVAKNEQDMGKGIYKLDYYISDMEGLAISDGKIHALEQGAWMTLTFNNKKKVETYVRLENTSIDSKSSVMKMIDAKRIDGITRPINIRSKYHNTYFGKDDFLANTGYSKMKRNLIKLSFPYRGTFSYDDIQIYSTSMKHYKKQVKKLRKTVLQNVQQKNNRLEGDVTLAKKGIMMLGIPYSKGWSAYVDGQKAQLLRGNVMYMALELPEGSHHINLKYETPFLKLGFVISLLAALVVAGIVWYFEYLQKKGIVLFHKCFLKKEMVNETAEITENTTSIGRNEDTNE